MWNEGFIQAELGGEGRKNNNNSCNTLNMLSQYVKCRPIVSLAVNRGEKLGALKLALTVPGDTYIAYMLQKLEKNPKSIFAEYKAAAA